MALIDTLQFPEPTVTYYEGPITVRFVVEEANLHEKTVWDVNGNEGKLSVFMPDGEEYSLPVKIEHVPTDLTNILEVYLTSDLFAVAGEFRVAGFYREAFGQNARKYIRKSYLLVK